MDGHELRNHAAHIAAEHHAADLKLLTAIKHYLRKLTELQTLINSHWGAEDNIYRFYHQSAKVYGIQRFTNQMEELFQLVAVYAGRPAINQWFTGILAEGTGKEFPWHDSASAAKVNAYWQVETRPMLEAFFHAKYFLDMMVKYGAELDDPPAVLPSGWAAVLYLYNIR